MKVEKRETSVAIRTWKIAKKSMGISGVPHSGQAVIRSMLLDLPDVGVRGELDLRAGDELSARGVFLALFGRDRGVTIVTPSAGACSACTSLKCREIKSLDVFACSSGSCGVCWASKTAERFNLVTCSVMATC